MFAAWEAGVWKALSGHFQPDIIVGTSAGAWNGWAIAGGATPEELIAQWLDPATATIMKPGLHGAGLLRPKMLHEKARELFARFRPRLPFGLTLAEIPRLRPHLIRDAAITWQHLAATCSIPFGFPPVIIDGRKYVDGGLLGALPLWAAGEMGASRAIALNVLNRLPFTLLRTVLRPRLPGSPIEVTHLEPSASLGSLKSAVFWSRGNIEQWIELGERDGKRMLTSITM